MESAPRDTVPPAAVPATGLTEAPLAAEATTDAEATEEDAAEATQRAGGRGGARRPPVAGGSAGLRRPPRPSPATAARLAPACASGRFVGTAVYLAPEATGVDVEVYVDEENGEVLAVDVATCEVVLRAASP